MVGRTLFERPAKGLLNNLCVKIHIRGCLMNVLFCNVVIIELLLTMPEEKWVMLVFYVYFRYFVKHENTK